MMGMMYFTYHSFQVVAWAKGVSLGENINTSNPFW